MWKKLTTCLPSSYGHYEIALKHRGRSLKAYTNNMPAVDDYKSDESERDGRELRVKRGFLELKAEILRKNPGH